MLFNYTNAKLSKLAIHFVGNKNLNERIQLSNSEVTDLSKDIDSALVNYFLSGFKSYELFNFRHESDLKLNNAFSFLSDIFDNNSDFFNKSISLSKHLYEYSLHPNIKGGELYISFIENCIINDEVVEVIAIVKSENKDSYLKVDSLNNNYHLDLELGLNLTKIDKGCLIFNQNREQGYKVLLIDNLNKSSEAQYWKNDFLKLEPNMDNYYITNNYLSATKQFVTTRLAEEYDLSKADQANILNKSVDYFKITEQFNENDFANTVLKDSQKKESFYEFKEEYEKEHNLDLLDEFQISIPAVKRQLKTFKSIIKLDKNFHIYVHGSNEFIEKGVDELTGLNYYKIFFKQEN